MSGRSSVPAIMTLETIAPLSTRRELASVGGLTDSALPEVTRHAVTVAPRSRLRAPHRRALARFESRRSMSA